MKYPPLLTALALGLLAWQAQSSTQQNPAISVPVDRTTQPTSHKFALDAAVWRDPAQPANSLLIVAAGEGGLEIHDLAGQRVAAFAEVEVGFVEVPDRSSLPQGLNKLVLVSDQRAGAVRAFRFDAGTRKLQEVAPQPLRIDDEITGLCSYVSPLTNKLYAFVSTGQGQFEQWELFSQAQQVAGRMVRRIAAGKGVGHCAVDDARRRVYFSEESVGVWSIAAEPESDTAREAVDLVAPRGGLSEEVKGIAVHPASGTTLLLARDADGFVAYSLPDSEPRRVQLGAPKQIGDAEGLTIAAEPLGGAFPNGVLIVADEDAGDYKLVSLSALTKSLDLPTAQNAAAASEFIPGAVAPAVESEPVASFGDAADDPAIWVDRQAPSRSVVIATDKKLGLNVYDLDGKLIHSVPDGRMNNVDVRDGFTFGGRPITLVAATNRTRKSISLYRYDAQARQLQALPGGDLATGFDDPYGLCMYRSAKNGAYYVFANDSADGRIRQWRVSAKAGKIAGELVREIEVGSQAEGCAADDELGHLYVAEEDVALWKYSAEPRDGSRRTSIDTVEKGRLTDDIEGLSIYYGANGAGYLVVSNQGEDNYAVYRREGNNEYLGKFAVVANSEAGIDGASETDGLDIVSAPLGERFPEGLLVVQDGRNLMPAERQNFKYVSWKDALRSLRKE
ncbi:phytase [Steroidobacter agaridevorans]|uniref:phytase n=1 Tax=Steroidobacter agaridevorans TaxID=2695856 RepID=UPI001324BA36|nr:phytase [Steroidobacter agaridevorans]GFE85932.1 myo-inositol-hexaphosphate 3-phosphohydrolase [Steroidobacter agaridevorans]